MSDEKKRNDRVEALAESFMDRLRRGEHPSVEHYAEEHPDLADEIRDLFPTLGILEKFGPPPVGQTESPTTISGLSELGEYRILREIARGGMGVVYEAEQLSLGRHVALKVLTMPSSSDQTFLKRFYHEARAAARLHHSNIVPVFAVGEHQGVHYYAMQFINGQSLDQVVRELRGLIGSGERPTDTEISPQSEPLNSQIAQHMLSHRFSVPKDSTSASVPSAEQFANPLSTQGPPPPDQNESSQHESNSSSVALPGQSELETPIESRWRYFHSVARVGVQVADALSYAHGQGILHRDIKPSNLLLDTQGTVWVTDLGLAKSESEDLTHAGDIVGTLRYMAPERFHGHTDARSDIYSLGMTLYELLVLKPAFPDSDRARLAKRIIHDNPPAPRKLNPDIPRDLETIIVKALDKEPRLRYQTAEQLANDLRWFLEDKPIHARRVTATERTWRWCRRNPVIASLTGSVGLLSIILMIALTVVLWLRLERNLAMSNRDLTAEAERIAQETTAKVRAAGQTANMFRMLAQARADRWRGQAGRRFDSLTALSGAAKLARTLPEHQAMALTLRNEAIACLALVDGRIDAHWSLGDRTQQAIVFSPNLDCYYVQEKSGAEAGEIVARRFEDHQELFRLAGTGLPVASLRLSRLGRWLAVKYRQSEDMRLYVWDLETQQPVLKLLDGVHENAVDFSPDETEMISSRPDGSLELHDLQNRGDPKRIAVVGSPHLIRYHPTRPIIALSSLTNPNVEVRDATDGKVLKVYPHPSSVRGIAWNPNGQLLASGCDDRSIYVWDTRTDERLFVLEGHQDGEINVDFGARGEILFSHSRDMTTKLWNPWTGKEHMSIPGRAIQFSPDDRRVAFSNASSVGIWELASEIECRTRAAPSRGAKHWGIAVDPRSTLIAVATDQGVQLWDLLSARTTSFLPTGNTRSVAFHPNGNEMITSSDRGLLRWPIDLTASDGIVRMQLGPPRSALAGTAFGRMCLTNDGERIVVERLRPSGTIVFPLHDLNQQSKLTDEQAQVAISPLGKYVATGSSLGSGVKIWKADSGEPVCTLAATAPEASALFSPDGKWLAISTRDNYDLFEVETWLQLRRFARAPDQSVPGPMGFSADGRILAIAHSAKQIRLVEPRTGLELATLEAPESDVIRAICFAPGGSHLAVSTNEYLQLWDLHLIREQLADMDLDWSSDPLPAVSAGSDPVQVQVDYGSLGLPD